MLFFINCVSICIVDFPSLMLIGLSDWFSFRRLMLFLLLLLAIVM